MIREKMIVDSIDFMAEKVKDPNSRIIAEGANATGHGGWGSVLLFPTPTK